MAGFNDGSAIGASAITSAALATAAVLPGKLAPSIFQGVTGGAQSPLTGVAYNDVASTSVTFTPAVASYMYIWYGGLIQINTVDTVNIALNIDAANVESTQFTNTTASQFITSPSRVYRATLTAASHTIKLQVKATNGAANCALTSAFWYGLLVSQ